MSSLRTALRLAQEEADKIQKEEDEKTGIKIEPKKETKSKPKRQVKRKKVVISSDEDDSDSGSGSSSDSSASPSNSSSSDDDEENELGGDADDAEAWCRKQLGYGADLYKDDRERETFEFLPEVEREMKLYERSEKYRKLLDTFKLRQLKKKQNRQQNKGKGKRLGKARKGKSALAKDKHPRSKKTRFEDSDDDEDRVSISSMSDSDDADADFKQEKEESNKGKSNNKQSNPEHLNVDLNDMRSMQITRMMLLKLVDEPFFEKVVGGFVRLSLGTNPDKPNEKIYRCCEIVEITPSHVVYSVEKKKVDKKLLLKFAKQEREWPIERISNGEITKEEFGYWKSNMLENRRTIPTKVDAKAFTKRLADTVENYVYTESDVLRKVQRQKDIRSKAVNITSEKEELKRRIKYFSEKGEHEKLKPLDEELSRIEREYEVVLEQKKEAGKTTDTINQRNKQKNIQALKDIYAARAQKAKLAVSNPYARQACRPRLLWATRKKEEETNGDKAEEKTNGADGSKGNKNIEQLEKERIEQAITLKKKRAAAAAQIHDVAFKEAKETQEETEPNAKTQELRQPPALSYKKPKQVYRKCRWKNI
eukprot:CAMPEP_0204844048 /NCGR_PEP_ID=MMETSP1346-20131115/48334_1 /ASSEMBLY_ACC=CAM_ASM_000771 /TAXON_ID=215587 /ORGANISM="Aplanochytrium stocchinoi, Strain GSBS06" /LENGTH=592 /DNA_ID=CAMNT_0051983293 /DNA_START=279 /DNA_END=2058 /DNA_ORIENTATION=-